MVNLLKEDTSITVRLDRNTWRALNALKEPAETFDAVIRRLLAEREKREGTPPE